MKRILALGALAVAVSTASYGVLTAFDAAEQRHRASVDAMFGRVAPLAPAQEDRAELSPDDSLAWENVRHLQVNHASDVR